MAPGWQDIKGLGSIHLWAWNLNFDIYSSDIRIDAWIRHWTVVFGPGDSSEYRETPNKLSDTSEAGLVY